MKLAWILWLSQVLPQPAADSLCLTTTVYLEARDQSVRGQQAVAEVALRRRDSGLWGDNVCDVVTARRQFAPSIVPSGTQLGNSEAWAQAVTIARVPTGRPPARLRRRSWSTRSRFCPGRMLIVALPEGRHGPRANSGAGHL